MKSLVLKALSSLAVLSVCAVVAVYWRNVENPSVRWRTQLVSLKVLGAVPHEGWGRILQRMVPSSHGGTKYYFNNFHIENPYRTAADVAAGGKVFREHCARCHGAGGKSLEDRDLTASDFQISIRDHELFLAIAQGVAGTSMPAFAGSTREALQLTAFVRSIGGASGSESSAARATRTASRGPCGPVHAGNDRIREADSDPGGWLTYSGTYSGRRFTTLQQINPGTISRLRPRWVYQMKSLEGLQSVPLVVDGVMYVTGLENEVVALDAATGQPCWVFERAVAAGTKVTMGRKNRGVAVLGDRVYHGTLDAHLIALDASTGRLIWDVEVADTSQGYSMTGAPLAVKDKIIVGMAGGDWGVRGFLDAYDAETGERAWRFHTIPAPGEAGHETWENDAWKTGGGATWVTGSYDPDLDLLYWGVGNPAPVWDGDYRPGDNLFTDSVIALDPDTGKLQWHFQFTPHDVNDWDAAIVPVLADLEFEGRPRSLMLWANRNCFFYVLDRETGQFLRATEYCEQNWNDGFSETGRPIRRPGTSPTEEGTIVYPGVMGGSNWYSPAFSPRTGFYYVTFRHVDEILYKTDEEFKPASRFYRGWHRQLPGRRASGGLRAIDARTGEVAWEVLHEEPTRSGILATDSGLVFTGNQKGTFFALDAASGEELWHMRLGGTIMMGPITYLLEGKQQIAVIARGSVVALELAE